MGPILIPFGRGFAKIRKLSISKILVGVGVQGKGEDYGLTIKRVRFGRNFSVQQTLVSAPYKLDIFFKTV